MCGIAGFIDYSPQGRLWATQTLRRMSGAIAHRGPDSNGHWVDREGHVGLGHRRLSIVDLSPTGAQPMTSESGRYTIVYNGEIYGFLGLRKELEKSGVQFRGSSDTEVLLATVEKFGFEAAMPKLSGMFAFAMYDHRDKCLIFGRDRLGKKPLYIGLSGKSLVFASELKGLRQHPAFISVEIDRNSVCSYLRRGRIPNPMSIYKDVFSLPPGSIVSVPTTRKPASISEIRGLVKPYWSVHEAVLCGREQRITRESEALELLDATLTESVADRMVADVPLGAFLSSGVDSSLVTAYMQRLSRQRIKTYTVRFIEAERNEADAAAAIAKHLGTEHTEISSTPNMALNLISKLPEVYDEPFADPSQIPTLLVAQLARKFVTVVLSGDGGDELFGGYKRYPQMLLMERLAGKLPPNIYKFLGDLPIGTFTAAAAVSRHFFSADQLTEVSGDRLKKLMRLLSVRDFDQRYCQFTSEWVDPGSVVIGGGEPAVAASRFSPDVQLDRVERMMFNDTVSYLPDDILVKVDRATMSVGLESRAPLLDHRLLELSWRMPVSMRFDGKSGKVALRQLLSRYVPLQMINKVKQGFGVPLDDWLRDPLREWANELLMGARLRKDEMFRPAPIEGMWREHLSGQRNWGTRLWTVLMFNAWYDRWSRPTSQIAE